MTNQTNRNMDHDRRDGEAAAYPQGRQPFGYRAITQWANARGEKYEIRRFDDAGTPAIGIFVQTSLIHGTPIWSLFRGTRLVHHTQASQ
ncbi:MAG: hypothetical protein P1U37_15400 [Minwuia sp.]|nr:hypothetical protein [Minwuia sp.]